MTVSKTTKTEGRTHASIQAEAKRLAEWWARLTETDASLLQAEHTLAFNIPKETLALELRGAIDRGIKHLNGVRPRLQEVESEFRVKRFRKMPRSAEHTGETIAEILERITKEQTPT